MRRTIVTIIMALILVPFGSGATCRQETAQNVVATFLNTLAQTAAQQLVDNAAKPMQTADETHTASEKR